MSNSSNVAIVTGASRGIGAAIAERLAADGFEAEKARLIRESRRRSAGHVTPTMSPSLPDNAHRQDMEPEHDRSSAPD